ncbi:MAG: 3-methyl-2-oxobutanoate hydroxymethyltransferase [Lentisphaerae bacterium]|nr:3-methyl-2-oxobutanoate hydroxymethyltransferase [Lentisphaerota bacterium]
MAEQKPSVSTFRKMKREQKPVVMLTAYDAPTAALAVKCGVDLLLVGDSVGNAVLGYTTTIPVTMEESLHHCRAVVRGTRSNAFVIGDMPFMSYHASEEQALLNAAKYLQDAGCDAVKLEGGMEVVSLVKRMTTAGVPVCAHIGLCPQQVKVQGGYRIAGRSEDAAERLMQEALALEEAGAFMIVLECVTAPVAEKITQALSIPTIGIGSGAGCNGQVQVVTDILGLSGYLPKHAKRYADLASIMENAFSSYVEDVRSGKFPTSENAHQ